MVEPQEARCPRGARRPGGQEARSPRGAGQAPGSILLNSDKKSISLTLGVVK